MVLKKLQHYTFFVFIEGIKLRNKENVVSY